jgi:hypothetical protein
MTTGYTDNYFPQLYFPQTFTYWPKSIIVFTGLSGFGTNAKRRLEALDAQREIETDAPRRLEALDAQEREAMYTPSLITLPDGTGYWLFGDGSRIMWGSGVTGTGGEVKRRLETLKVKRDG